MELTELINNVVDNISEKDTIYIISYGGKKEYIVISDSVKTKLNNLDIKLGGKSQIFKVYEYSDSEIKVVTKEVQDQVLDIFKSKDLRVTIIEMLHNK